MAPSKKIKHLQIDTGIYPKDVWERLKRHGVKISKQYVQMILSGERTGYRYRPMIAKIYGTTEREIFGERKSRRQRGVVPHEGQGSANGQQA